MDKSERFYRHGADSLASRVVPDQSVTEQLLKFIMRHAKSAIQFGVGTQMILSHLDRAARERFPHQD